MGYGTNGRIKKQSGQDQNETVESIIGNKFKMTSNASPQMNLGRVYFSKEQSTKTGLPVQTLPDVTNLQGIKYCKPAHTG